jgi:hypothetical protein
MSKITNIVLAVLLLLTFYKSCQTEKDRDNLLTQISTYQLGEKQFKINKQKDSSTIAQQGQTIMTQDEAIKLGILKLEGEIKKVQSQVQQTQDVVIKKVEVPYIPQGYADTSWVSQLLKGDKTPELCDSLLANSVIVPQPFKLENKWYNISGSVEKKGLQLDSLKLTNQSDVTIGYKKSGFLGLSKTPIVEIKNSNPYFNVTKMNNVVIKKNKSIFEKKTFWAGIGIIGGFILKNNL